MDQQPLLDTDDPATSGASAKPNEDYNVGRIELEIEPEKPQIAFTKFFSYIGTTDKVLLVVGTICSVLAGTILPSISLIMGNVAAAFSGNVNVNTDILRTMTIIGVIVSMIALSLFICAYVFYAFWNHLAANISKELRKRYIAALMQ